MDLYQLVIDFNKKFGVPTSIRPRELPLMLSLLRITQMIEEQIEYEQAVDSGDIEGQLDALVDLVYFAMGTAHCHGFDFNLAFQRVHASNMKKIPVPPETPDGSGRGSKYDVIKPEGWVAPDLSDLV